jgi:hypothetical protein
MKKLLLTYAVLSSFSSFADTCRSYRDAGIYSIYAPRDRNDGKSNH